jgi:hypothetical protein
MVQVQLAALAGHISLFAENWLQTVVTSGPGLFQIHIMIYSHLIIQI